MYELTDTGKKTVEQFINDCENKRNEILDAEKDTADETYLPIVSDILSDINIFIDEDGTYYNCWGITDNCNSAPLQLSEGKDFYKK